MAIVGPILWCGKSSAPLGASRFALGATAQKGRHQVERIRAQRTGNRDEFHDIETTLAPFVFRDKGLGLLQTKRESLLGQPGGLACPDHQLAKSGLVGRMDGFADSSGG